MKKIKLILTGIVLSASSLVSAQEEIISIPRFHLGIEVGTATFWDATLNKPGNLRESRSYYDDYYDYDYYCGFVHNGPSYNLYYFGLKPEYSIDKRWAVAAGLRFSFNPSRMESDKDYFLWKTEESGVNTNYVKIRNISQTNIFVGVPLEVKFSPRETDYLVRQYFILGTAFNRLIGSKNQISYENRTMEKYNSLISEQIGKPNAFMGYSYLGVGLKIGHSNRPLGNIEIHLPVLMFNNKKLNSFTSAQDVAGISIQATLQIPVWKNRKLNYKVDNN